MKKITRKEAEELTKKYGKEIPKIGFQLNFYVDWIPTIMWKDWTGQWFIEDVSTTSEIFN